jgi:hypothetical protein
MVLGACSIDSDTFSNLSVAKVLPRPPDFSEKQSWGTLSVSDAPKMASKPVTADDLISSDGRCTGAAAEATPENANVGGVAGDLAPAAATAPPVSGGIALGMTECEVARRSGSPERVDISADAHAERAVVLTYNRGEHPGIYHFTAGRLTSMEAINEPAPASKSKSPAKKRATSKQPQQISRQQ